MTINQFEHVEMFGDFPVLQLRGVAKFLNGSNAEKDIDLRIVVEDENDCAPVLNFTTGSIPELSAKGTVSFMILMELPQSFEVFKMFVVSYG